MKVNMRKTDQTNVSLNDHWMKELQRSMKTKQQKNKNGYNQVQNSTVTFLVCKIEKWYRVFLTFFEGEDIIHIITQEWWHG